MIFATVGTNEAPFDRLLRAIAELIVDDDVLVQHGHSAPIGPPGARLVDFLSFDEINDTVRKARVVITHAGVGSIMVALANESRPIVLPRRKQYGEAVDDHQLQLGRRFAAAGLVTLVEEPADLRTVLLAEHESPAVIAASSRLAGDLRVYLETSLAEKPRRMFA
jgi:UDP-N-acetylglucosamine transferase subunit ALG13